MILKKSGVNTYNLNNMLFTRWIKIIGAENIFFNLSPANKSFQ